MKSRFQEILSTAIACNWGLSQRVFRDVALLFAASRLVHRKKPNVSSTLWRIQGNRSVSKSATALTFLYPWVGKVPAIACLSLDYGVLQY